MDRPLLVLGCPCRLPRKISMASNGVLLHDIHLTNEGPPCWIPHKKHSFYPNTSGRFESNQNVLNILPFSRIFCLLSCSIISSSFLACSSTNLLCLSAEYQIISTDRSAAATALGNADNVGNIVVQIIDTYLIHIKHI